MPSRAEAEPFSVDTFVQGESPRVDPRTGELLWIDMRAGSLHTGRLEGGALHTTRSVEVAATVGAPSVGAATPLVAAGEGWAIGAGRDLVHVAEDGALTTLVSAITPDSRFTLNDGIAAPDGAYWIGSQTGPRRPEGSLYRIDETLQVTRVLGGVTVSNGIAFDADGRRIHYIDTLPHRRLETFRVAGGALSQRSTVTALQGGNPDGLALDAEGHVWVAMWDAGEVRRIAPDGTVSEVVAVPVPRPSAVALWEGLLVITTAAQPGIPHSGRLFAAPVDVPGVPATSFGLRMRSLQPAGAR